MIERIKALAEPERNRRYLYGVIEAGLYACVGFGLVSAEHALLLLAVPAAALGLARSKVQN